MSADTTTTTLRNIDRRTLESLKLSAHARGWTMAQYVERLYALHMDALKDPCGLVSHTLSVGMGEVSL